MKIPGRTKEPTNQRAKSITESPKCHFALVNVRIRQPQQLEDPSVVSRGWDEFVSFPRAHRTDDDSWSRCDGTHVVSERRARDEPPSSFAT
jgi:hypothetical protein